MTEYRIAARTLLNLFYNSDHFGFFTRILNIAPAAESARATRPLRSRIRNETFYVRDAAEGRRRDAPLKG